MSIIKVYVWRQNFNGHIDLFSFPAEFVHYTIIHSPDTTKLVYLKPALNTLGKIINSRSEDCKYLLLVCCFIYITDFNVLAKFII